jgi:broad specificity phosphatase PhoE
VGRLADEEVAMATTIVLLRHTDNDGDVLSAEGVTAAVALGAMLDGPFDLAVSTGAQRATQTVACILGAMQTRVPDGVIVETGLRSDVEDRWRAAYVEAGGGELDDFMRVAPDLVAAESTVLAAALSRVADRLDDGQRALVVGHSPTNEAAVYGLTGERIASLGKGDGVEITIDGGRATVAPLTHPA